MQGKQQKAGKNLALGGNVYSTLDFPAENRVPTGMQNSPESIKAFAVFDVTFNIYS